MTLGLQISSVLFCTHTANFIIWNETESRCLRFSITKENTAHLITVVSYTRRQYVQNITSKVSNMNCVAWQWSELKTATCTHHKNTNLRYAINMRLQPLTALHQHEINKTRTAEYKTQNLFNKIQHHNNDQHSDQDIQYSLSKIDYKKELILFKP